MKTITKTFNVYSLNELNENAKIGYACYDVSDKDVTEYCDAMEYLFFEDGAVYGYE